VEYTKAWSCLSIQGSIFWSHSWNYSRGRVVSTSDSPESAEAIVTEKTLDETEG